MADEKDTGLGLTEFLSATSEGEETPSPEVPTETVTETPAEEAKPEAEVKPEEKPSFDWEADDNPYKQRYWETQKWANKVNQENIERQRAIDSLQQKLTVIDKKLDGTYDPDTDEPKAPPPPDVNEVAESSNVVGRIVASRQAAIEGYGQDFVENMVFAPNSPFRQIENSPYVQMRVLQSPAPVLEAIKIVKEKAFFDKYGYDFDAIEVNMEKALEGRIRDKVLKEVAGKASLRGTIPQGIGNAQNATPGTNLGPTDFTPLGDIFRR